MTAARPLIAAAIIVKNESEHLRRCLGSIQDFCDEIIVVDTGSTDETVSIAESFGARVLHKPWKNDFAASRNFALDAVTAEWVLYIDADEELIMKSVDEIRAEISRATDVMAFGLRMHTQANWTPYADYRLWRHQADIRFTGEIHESSLSDIMRVARETSRVLRPIDIDIMHHGYAGDLTAKHQRNLPLLLAELKVHPEKINLWNHLGRVHEALGRSDLAEQAWRTGIQRLEMSGPLSRFDIQIYASLADFMIARGMDAQAIIDRGRSFDPDFKTFLWLQVRQHMLRREHQQAINMCDRLLEIGRSGSTDDGVAYNLDMFSEWPRLAKVDCLFQLLRFEEVRSELENRRADLAPGSHGAKLLEVCEAYVAWRGSIECDDGSHSYDARTSLEDVDFIIPVRLETADRLANVLILVRRLSEYHGCRILVGCEQPEPLRALLGDRAEVIGVDGSPDHAFHVSRVMNEVARHSDAPIRVHCDTDVIIPVEQLLAAISVVRRGDADMAIPFSFGIGVPQSERDSFGVSNPRIDAIRQPRVMMGVPPGLCQVWSRTAFEKSGMENEFLTGWGPDDAERLERLSILGRRVVRIDGPAFHLDHAQVSGRDQFSEYHALSQAERERIGSMSKSELEDEISGWPWIRRGTFPREEAVDASDLTVLIPMRVDTPDRVRNVITCTTAILNSLNCRVVVGIGDPSLLMGSLDPRVEIVAVPDDPRESFHRTRMINLLASKCTTSFIAIVDTDVVVSSNQWVQALDLLRRSEADFVYPYDGRMVEVPYGAHSWLERGEFDALPPSAVSLIEPLSVGGCFIVVQDRFLEYGMENENFISWGYEDNERLIRAHKFGLRVRRVDGVIHHIAHRRGLDSQPNNPHVHRNAEELRRIKNLTDRQLRAEVRMWSWMTNFPDVKVLIWNNLWHDDRQLVDIDDRGIEVVRVRERLDECDIVVVGLATLDTTDLPPAGGATRVLLTREADVHVSGVDDPDVTKHFERIASHRLTSDLWCPYLPKALLDELPPITPVSERSDVLASAWISSGWDASGRTRLLEDLMLFMQVDSFGRVAKNTGDRIIHSHSERWAISARYRFVLAFENAREPDYVTEKFFEPLIFGAVPVYLGAPNVEDFAPGDHCFIDASTFSSARDLAEFLTTMSEADYERYHSWRNQPRRSEFIELCERLPRTFLSPLISSIREQRSQVPTR